MAAVTQQPLSGSLIQNSRSFPNGVTVRNMTSADCNFAGKLLVQSFESKFEHAVGRNNLNNVIQASTAQHQQMGERYHRIWIAEMEGRPAGLVELLFHGERNNIGDDVYEHYLSCWPLCRLACMGCVIDGGTVPKGQCYLDHIAVDDGFRGKGIGKVLMQVAEEEAIKNNCKIIFLWVADDNRAKNLYQRQGYSVTKQESGCCLYCATGRNKFLKMKKILS